MTDILGFSSCRDADDPSVFVLVAHIGECPVGSVAVKEWADGDISIARLFTEPEYRRKGIACQVMRRVFRIYPDAEAWLYARQYNKDPRSGLSPSEQPLNSLRPGPDTRVLEKFYMSLGFMTSFDGDGKPAMVRRKDGN